jgi:hypothetical protein
LAYRTPQTQVAEVGRRGAGIEMTILLSKILEALSMLYYWRVLRLHSTNVE